MSISVVLVTCNSAALISATLQAVQALPHVAECIVVDNDSHDDTCDIIDTEFPDVQLIRNTSNMGFARAVNQGVAFAEHPYVLLMNPDAGIAPQGLERLMEVLQQRPQAACAAPVFSGGGEQGAESLRPPEIMPPDAALATATDAEGVYAVRFVSGALALFRTEYLRAVNGFDEAFFLFFEDDDLSIRLHEAGHELLLVLGVQAHHRVGESTPRSEAVAHLKHVCWYWSRWYLHRKHRGWLAAWQLRRRDKQALQSLRQELTQMPLDKALVQQASRNAERLHAQALLQVELQLLDAQNRFEQALYARMVEMQTAPVQKKAFPLLRTRADQHKDYAEHMQDIFKTLTQTAREEADNVDYALPDAWQELAQQQAALWQCNAAEQAEVHARLGECLQKVKHLWEELAELDAAFLEAEEQRSTLWKCFYEEVDGLWMPIRKRHATQKHANALAEALAQYHRNPQRFG